MALLLDQFIESAQEWHRRVPQPHRESRQSAIVFLVMFWTGGSRHVRRLDARDEKKLTPEQKKELTVSDVRGYYSLDQVKNYLHSLMNQTGLLEIFFIPALVRGVEAEFEKYVTTSDERAAQREANISELKEIIADPYRRAQHVELLKKVHEEMIAEGNLAPDAVFDEEEALQQDLEMLERIGGYNPEAKAREEQNLLLWREVTAPIMTPENLKRATDEMMEQWRRQKEG